MSDEFPTLEVVLAASVVVLLWRGYLLHRSRSDLSRAAERLIAAFRHGMPSARQLTEAELGPLVEPLARAAVMAQGDETARSVAERTARIRKRVQSAAARDLVVCAVLGGSLIYTSFARMVVGSAFYALGAIAALLLLVAVLERVLLDRELGRVGGEFGRSLASLVKPSTREGSACRICGEPARERLATQAELGPRLWALGAREVFACGRCGQVSGKVSPFK